METSKNSIIYNVLKSLGFPSETILKVIISLHWKSIRNFSRHIGFSHVAVSKAIRDKSSAPQVRKAISDALGFDPWGNHFSCSDCKPQRRGNKQKKSTEKSAC